MLFSLGLRRGKGRLPPALRGSENCPTALSMYLSSLHHKHVGYFPASHGAASVAASVLSTPLCGGCTLGDVWL